MEILQTILELIKAIIEITPALIAFYFLIKNIIIQKNWKLLEPIIREAMSTVESYAKDHPEMTSDDKLNMAIEVIKNAASVNEINLNDETIIRIIEYIKKLCSWSKTVNCK